MNISQCKCGGNAIIRQDHFSVSYGDWKIFCEKCGMQTGWTKNKEDAIELWNRVMGATDINVGNKFDKDINVPTKERTAKVKDIVHTHGYPDEGLCGNCNEDVNGLYDYCPYCGARLEWE